MGKWTDILYYHSGDLTLWLAAACAAHNCGPRALIAKKRHILQDIETETETEIQTDIQTDI